MPLRYAMARNDSNEILQKFYNSFLTSFQAA